MRDYIAIANQYIDDVLSGAIPSCKLVKLSCKRQKQDLKRKRFDYTFDEKRAVKICKFIELLRHVKGPLGGERITLEPWQIFILTTIFGWIDKKGFRRYQRAYIEVARGNGKSTLLSGIGLFMLSADGEPGADVYSFATTRDQAKIVFNDAQSMARKAKDLQEAFGLSVLAHSMVVIGTNSKFLPMSADAGTLDGLNTHCGIIDELHAHKTRDVYDVVETSLGKRNQPLLITITTAGFNLTGVCMEKRTYVSKILNGKVDDPTQFGIIYTVDDGDDWTSELALRKANPNWGVSVTPKVILATLKMAMATPSAENNFKTKHLDIWCNANSAFLQMSKWRRCYRPTVTLEDFEGEPCIYGLDLAAKTDLCCLIRLFWREEDDGKIHYYVFPEFWLPESTVHNSKNSQYVGWAKQELFHVTQGEINDFDAIQEFIQQDTERFQTLAVAFDPWNAYQLASNLVNNGIEMVEIKQTTFNMSEPMKQMQALIYSNRLHTDGNPVLEWNASNLVAHTDANDNVFPRKESPENKIDGMVALIMAIKQSMFMDVENEYLGSIEVPTLVI